MHIEVCFSEVEYPNKHYAAAAKIQMYKIKVICLHARPLFVCSEEFCQMQDGWEKLFKLFYGKQVALLFAQVLSDN